MEHFQGGIGVGGLPIGDEGGGGGAFRARGRRRRLCASHAGSRDAEHLPAQRPGKRRAERTNPRRRLEESGYRGVTNSYTTR